MPTTKGHAPSPSTMSTLPKQCRSFLSALTSLGRILVEMKVLHFQMAEVPLCWYLIVIRTSLDTSVEISAIERKEEPTREQEQEKEKKLIGPNFPWQRCYYLSSLHTWSASDSLLCQQRRKVLTPSMCLPFVLWRDLSSSFVENARSPVSKHFPTCS